MWNCSGSYENCKNCSDFSFLIEELTRVRFVDREKDDLWRIYKDPNEHSFEVEKID